MYKKYNKLLSIINSQINNKSKNSKKIITLLHLDYLYLLQNTIMNDMYITKNYNLNKVQSKIFVKNSIILLNKKIHNRLTDKVDISRQKIIHNGLIELCDSFFKNLELNNTLTCNFDLVYSDYDIYIQKINDSMNKSKYFHPYTWFINHFDKFFPLYNYSLDAFANKNNYIFKCYDISSKPKTTNILNFTQNILFKDNLFRRQFHMWNTDKNFRSTLSSYRSINDIVMYHVLIMHILILYNFTTLSSNNNIKYLINILNWSEKNNVDLLFLALINKIWMNFYINPFVKIINTKKCERTLFNTNNFTNEHDFLNYLWNKHLCFCNIKICFVNKISIDSISIFHKEFFNLNMYNSNINLLFFLPKVQNILENQYIKKNINEKKIRYDLIFKYFEFFIKLISFASVFTTLDNKFIFNDKFLLYSKFIKNFNKSKKTIKKKHLGTKNIKYWKKIFDLFYLII